jgi:hypothetical protein
MGMNITKSFDFAEFRVDYVKKKVDVSHPYKSPLFLEYLLLVCIYIGVGILICFPLIIFNIFFYVPKFLNSSFVILVFLGIIVYDYFTDKIRFIGISIAKDDDQAVKFSIHNVTSKKVVLQNVGNLYNEWEATGDYSKYLKRLEIKCVRLKKSLGWMNTKYRWEIHLFFKEVPKTGFMSFQTQRQEDDFVLGNGEIRIKQVGVHG